MKKGRDDLAKFIVFLLNPIIGLLYSLRRMNTKGSVAVIFCLFLLFGLSFTVDSVLFSADATSQYLDGMSHRATFEQYASMTWSDFLLSIKGVFLGDGERDIYAPVMKFMVSRFTGNYHFFFLAIAFVFSFFCLKSFSYLLTNPNFDNSVVSYFMAYIFMLIQIFQINGVRFYTAAWVAIYALFKIFADKNNKYIILILLTPLIHRAYLIFVVVFILGYILRRFDKLWVWIYVISIFVSEIVSGLLANNIHILPDFLASWAGYYVDQEMNFGDGGLFFDIFSLLVRLYRNLLIILIINKSSKIKENPNTRYMYVFLLVLAAFSNMTMPISNLGSRFAMLTWPLIAFIWLANLKHEYKWAVYLVPVVFFYNFFYYDPQMYLLVVEPCFFYYPPLLLIAKYLIV